MWLHQPGAPWRDARRESGAPTLADLEEVYASERFAMFAAVAGFAAALRLCKSLACGPAWAAPLLTALGAAMCACMSQLFLKLVSASVGELPSSIATLGLAIVGLSASAPLHLRLLNMTLAGASISVAVPCYQFLMILTATAAGGVLFDEFSGQSYAALGAYSLGVCTAALGLALLSSHSSADDDDVDDADAYAAGSYDAVAYDADADASDADAPLRAACEEALPSSATSPSSLDEEISPDDGGDGSRATRRHSLARRPSLLVRRNSALMVGGLTGIGFGAARSKRCDWRGSPRTNGILEAGGGEP